MTDGTRENDPPSLCIRWSVVWAIVSVVGLVGVIAFAMALYLKAPIER